ncbi:MAG TPA: acyl-CoA dehydrogenase family protein [Thermoanaerobaculia bacterium]|nr:acyl-CoA dehydrogenase family protein [Thermoanaerobaculia bacterium]
MDFDLSKPQKLLRDSARGFLLRECKAERVRAAMATDTADDRALYAAAADQGWTALIVPEQYGGLGLGFVELAVVCEEMGRACMPGPLFATIVASAAIVCAGSDEQKAQWLEPIAAGELRATLALANQFVFDAGVADLVLRFAGEGIEAISNANPRRTPSMDETRKLYSIDASGFGTHERAIDIATVALCAEMVGGMQWILDTTVEYAKTRQQFGRVIGSFQAVQHQCADMLLLTESARSATLYAAWALTHDDPQAALATSIAKAYCSDAVREVANRGVQVHGGIGFTWEHDLQLYYKRAKASETTFGDATVHRERIASLVIDRVAAGRPSSAIQQISVG